MDCFLLTEIMQATIIPSDRFIRKDSLQANLTDWPFDDSGVHAIQWYGEYGEIEFTGTPKRPNEVFASTSVLDEYLVALEEHLSSAPETGAPAP